MPIVFHGRNDSTLNRLLIASMLLPISVECTAQWWSLLLEYMSIMFVRKSTYIAVTFASRDIAQNPSPLLSCPHARERFRNS